MIEEFLNKSSQKAYMNYVRNNSADMFLAQYVSCKDNWGVFSSILIPSEIEFGKTSDNVYRVVRELKPIIDEISETYINNPTNTSWLNVSSKLDDKKFRLGLINFNGICENYDAEHYEKYPEMTRPYRQAPSDKSFDLINVYRQMLDMSSLQVEKVKIGKFDPKKVFDELELKLVSNE